jgi:hypothetical protein
VDAPGGGINPVEHVIREKKNDEREVAQDLYEAITHDDVDKARLIMQTSLTAALIDAPTSQPGGSFLTKAMVLAAKKGYFELIGLFLHNGGNPDLQALNQGYTLMHEAILAGQPAVVEVLCQENSRTDLCNTHGMNARDIAEACVAGRMGTKAVELERYQKCLDTINTCSKEMQVKDQVDHACQGIRHWGKEVRSAVGPPRTYRIE